MTLVDGAEVLLDDPARRPRSWTDAMRTDQYAVILTDIATSLPCSSGGVLLDASRATCTVFDCLSAAERFTHDRARVLPGVRCEIFDAEGRARQPLLVVTHAGAHEALGRPSQRRRLAALALVVASLPLLWIDWRNDFQIIVPTIVGLTCLATAVRLVYWDLGEQGLERERRQRLDEHRRRARPQSPSQS